MKKTFLLTLLTAFAMASAVFAQTEDKDTAWAEKSAQKAAKEAAKAEKAQKAADLKAFKEKQKAELAAFVEAQKAGKSAGTANINVQKPELQTTADSVAYLFGVMQSNGLDKYATQQLGVDESHFGKFAEGILSRIGMDTENKEEMAYFNGGQVGGQVVSMVNSLAKDYYAADPDKKIDVQLVANGLVAGLLGKSDITSEDAAQTFNTMLEAQHAANKEAMYGPNREAGEKFLAENKTKEGVVTLPSGLQYKIITAGTGATPSETDKVSVDYEGRLIDGTVFDSSYKRGKPSTFGVTQVIKGWTEALQLMPVGSKWELYIPYELAYGDRETGKEIKPYSALVFTIELKGIE